MISVLSGWIGWSGCSHSWIMLLTHEGMLCCMLSGYKTVLNLAYHHFLDFSFIISDSSCNQGDGLWGDISEGFRFSSH